MELLTDFLSLGRGSVKFIYIEKVSKLISVLNFGYLRFITKVLNYYLKNTLKHALVINIIDHKSWILYNIFLFMLQYHDKRIKKKKKR